MMPRFCLWALLPLALWANPKVNATTGGLFILNNMSHNVELHIGPQTFSVGAGSSLDVYFTRPLVGIPSATGFVKWIQHWERGARVQKDTLTITLRPGYRYTYWLTQGLGKKMFLDNGVIYQAGSDGTNTFHNPFTDSISGTGTD